MLPIISQHPHKYQFHRPSPSQRSLVVLQGEHPVPQKPSRRSFNVPRISPSVVPANNAPKRRRSTSKQRKKLAKKNEAEQRRKRIGRNTKKRKTEAEMVEETKQKYNASGTSTNGGCVRRPRSVRPPFHSSWHLQLPFPTPTTRPASDRGRPVTLNGVREEDRGE